MVRAECFAFGTCCLTSSYPAVAVCVSRRKDLERKAANGVETKGRQFGFGVGGVRRGRICGDSQLSRGKRQ